MKYLKHEALCLLAIFSASLCLDAETEQWSVPEVTSNLCGPFAVFACLHWSGEEVPFSEILLRSGDAVAEQGMHVLKLEQVLESFGFRVRTYYCRWSDLARDGLIGIVYTQRPEAVIGHFAAIRARADGRIELFDPPRRPIVLDPSEMSEGEIVFTETTSVAPALARPPTRCRYQGSSN